MPNKRKPRIVGRCYVCGLGVMNYQAVRVSDYGVYIAETNLPLRRLAHAGECASTLETRINIGRTESKGLR